jgi:hypothetical protein
MKVIEVWSGWNVVSKEVKTPQHDVVEEDVMAWQDVDREVKETRPNLSARRCRIPFSRFADTKR